MFPERLVLPEGFRVESPDDSSGVVLDGAVARHLVQVLRIRKGQSLRLGDGLGRTRMALVSDVQRRALSLEWSTEVERVERPSPEIVLALAMIEASDLRRAVEGAVEAGVDRVVLFRAHHSNRALPAIGDALWEKLVKIIRLSCEQSKRAWVPELELCTDVPGFLQSSAQIVVAHGGFRLQSLVEICSGWDSDRGPMVVAVGPEGGWGPEELKGFESADLPLGHLGESVLRARTAAPVVVNHLQLVRTRLNARASS